MVLLCSCLALSACGSKGPVEPVMEGEAIANSKACFSCHTVDGAKSVGPTWKGLAGSKVALEDGSTVTATDEYLRESMLEPSAKTVKGFPHGLMETVIKPGSLSEEEADALIEYLKSLD